jgi:hypothetical protein
VYFRFPQYYSRIISLNLGSIVSFSTIGTNKMFSSLLFRNLHWSEVFHDKNFAYSIADKCSCLEGRCFTGRIIGCVVGESCLLWFEAIVTGMNVASGIEHVVLRVIAHPIGTFVVGMRKQWGCAAHYCNQNGKKLNLCLLKTTIVFEKVSPK